MEKGLTACCPRIVLPCSSPSRLPAPNGERLLGHVHHNNLRSVRGGLQSLEARQSDLLLGGVPGHVQPGHTPHDNLCSVRGGLQSPEAREAEVLHSGVPDHVHPRYEQRHPNALLGGMPSISASAAHLAHLYDLRERFCVPGEGAAAGLLVPMREPGAEDRTAQGGDAGRDGCRPDR
jgi:hypothetical protein